ncbi:MAG: hypothetical protein KatS3mg090_0390 [Patescibacteria group bacterium]|nr:MAG: hypothetical protein KatS3mg090_0390 [Patescibacteria group bacterium]
MYYLKYRPQSISELDNPKARELLYSILKQNKDLPHAFIFTGQRGTGKTSSARILAKAINCLNNKFANINDKVDPCGKCSMCQQITNEAISDVVELDAASHRGIDDIKNLIREAHFAPMSARHKVFIIDEAHMITYDAFNALLKTLEEPPDKTIFILATTNPEKLPETIKSRCVIVNFGAVTNKDIVSMLKRIISGEQLKIDEKTLELIAETANNSFRDAAKILEELVSLDKLEYDQALAHLYTRDNKQLLEILLDKDLQTAIDWAEEFYKQGGDIKNLISFTLKNAKEQMIANIKQNKKTLVNKLALILKLFQRAYQELRYTPNDLIPLELAIIEFYNSTKPN